MMGGGVGNSFVLAAKSSTRSVALMMMSFSGGTSLPCSAMCLRKGTTLDSNPASARLAMRYL